MPGLPPIGFYSTYSEDPLVRENRFIGAAQDTSDPPSFESARALLPQPFWQGHESTIQSYWKVWELAFDNIRGATPGNGFPANVSDTAFNGCIFMWDSVFVLFFGRYGRRAHDFQRTLDTFYSKQHPDGFICREIRISNGGDLWHRFDPASTGPNILAWSEWEHFLETEDRARLERVFPPLLAFHRWMMNYRTWPNGLYWTSGYGCGMDNQPRFRETPGVMHEFSHGHLAWVDATFQQVLNAKLLLKMADVLGRRSDARFAEEELVRVEPLAHRALWDEHTGFYYDLLPDGTLSGVKTIASFWALLAGGMAPQRQNRLVAHLRNPAEFHRPHVVPSLSFDHPDYDPEGGYWIGSVWPSTNYMILRGLRNSGCHALAHEIGLNHVTNVTKVFEETGTLHENYAPETAAPGNHSLPNVVGWGGLGPVAVLFEHVMGLRPDVPAGRLVWDIRLTEAHGVERYPFGAAGELNLACKTRSNGREKPHVRVATNIPIEIELRWAFDCEILRLEPGEHSNYSGNP